MPEVAIVTDTIACLPPEVVKEYGITVIPIVLTIDGKSYRDMIDMNNKDFWERFESIKSFGTSAPSPGDFMAAFKAAGKTSNEIVCTLVSKALSATYQSAVQACSFLKAENPALKVDIVDSRTAIGAEGFVVLEGARAARAGKSKAEVIETMQDMIKKVRWINGMETTKYIIKIGRAPKTVPTEIFAQLKPMIAQLHNTGVVEDIGVARSKEECFQKIVDTIGQYADPGKPLHVNVHYTDNIENGHKLTEMIKAKYQVAELFLTPYSAVLCGTTGPCNAVSFYS